MQLVKASRDALLKPLLMVSGIVERRHTLAILANILIRKEGELLSFLTSDTELQISTKIPIDLSPEPYATTVAARKLLDILRTFNDAQEVGLTVSGKKLNVQSGKSRFSLQTMPAEDFPLVVPPSRWNTSLSLPQKDLKHLFDMVHFSMAQQDIRYYLNGMLLVVDGKSVHGVATDGHRLAYSAVHTDTEYPKQEVIIPRKTITEMLRLLSDSTDLVNIDIASNQIKFSFGNIELISKLVEGKFPDYQRVIPVGYNKTFSVKRDALQQSLQRAAILTTEKLRGVRLIMQDNTLKILSTNAEQEEAQEELEIEYNHAALDVGFNVGYLLDVLANLKTEQIQWSMGDANTSVLITLPDHKDFKYVVMPMRI